MRDHRSDSTALARAAHFSRLLGGVRAALIGMVCALAACGGDNGFSLGGTQSRTFARHFPGFGAPVPASCSGADLSGVSAPIFVSPQGTDRGGCGQSTSTACKTIQQGIDNCSAPGCAVLVRYGLYPASRTIQLRDGVSVYGGCRFDGEPDRKYRTTIQANPLPGMPPGMPAVNADGINSPTTVHGLVVIGKDETASGSASIAMAVSDSKALALTGSVLAAGKGGDGAQGASSNGAQGEHGQSPTCLTCRGAAGKACPSNPSGSNAGDGGAGAAQNNLFSHTCVFNCYCDSLSGADRFGLTGQDSGSVKGGAGGGPGAIGCNCWERFSQSATPVQETGLWNPGVGATGGPGDAGQCSTQGGIASGLIWGSPSAQGTTWLPSAGGHGQTASVGAGGGGGGSAGYATDHGSDYPGISGGGGGGGGCGGPGGQGGQQGGASLALLLADSAIAGVAQQNSVVPGMGGRGGAGGAGGVGGPGGSGGAGSTVGRTPFDVPTVCHANLAPAFGGPGGSGGQGGAGSGGAGGDGGPSIGIGLRGNSPPPSSTGGIYLGTPGSGGGNGAAGVNPNCTGAPGANGAAGGSARVFDLDKAMFGSRQPAQTLAGAPGTSASAQSVTPSCPESLIAGGHDYHGLTLTQCSFSGLDLSQANFKGATLTGVVFIKANLSGADFSGATIGDGGSAASVTDFSFANLAGAKFVGTTFNARTYFTYASLTCADFSSTDIDTGNAIFGDQPLVIAPNASCRTQFRNTTMNCEFVPQWGQFDLTGAKIAACAGQLQTVAGGAGHDFSGGLYAGVVFDGLNLAGSKWTGAVLERASFQGATLDNATGLAGTAAVPSRLSAAKFNKASVQNVDLSNAQLYGAQFPGANLSNASLAGSFFGANDQAQPPITNTAVFDGAHLRNVNLTGAHLAGTYFRFASFYSANGSVPTFPCKTTCGPPGFTCQCSTASGANLTGTDFSNAYLAGVDFSGTTTTVNGTKFGAAILIGASFAGAKFEASGGPAPDFTKALLQGTIFESNANLGNTSFLNAFLDFGAKSNTGSGNALYMLLSADYTGFPGWPGVAKPCVKASYNQFSAVPSIATMICPNGNSAVCGAGNDAASIAYWKSSIPMSQNEPVQGWYDADATYDKVTPNATCNAINYDTRWSMQ